MSGYAYGNPGVWGTAGPLPRTGNPGVWGTAGPLKKKKPAATSTNAAAAVQGYDPFASAMASTDQIIAALLADVQRDQEAARASAMREAEMEAEKGRALAYGLRQLGIADTVNRIFQTAAANQANLAQGFSGQIRDQANQQAQAQVQALLGTGQEGAVRNQGENMGNVQYGLGGSIPGTELSTLGAAFGAQQALEPAFAEQFGALAEAKRRQQWANDLSEWANRRAEIIGKKPGLFQDFYSQERSTANDKWEKAMKEREFAYASWKDRRDFAYQKYLDGLNAQIATGKLDVDKAQTALDQWEAENPEPIWRQDKATGQWLMIDPRTGTVMKTVGNPKPPKPPSTAKTAAERAAERAARIVKAREAEIAKISGVPPEAKTFLGVGDSGQVKSPTRSRAELVRYLVRLYRQRLRRYGVRDKRIVTLVNEMVAAMPNNWFRGGRPAAGAPSASGNPFG